MKNRLIAIAAGGILLFGVLSFVTFGPPDVFAAEAPAEEYEAGSPGAWLSSLLDRLVDEGIISPEQAEDIEEQVPDEARDFLRRPFRFPNDVDGLDELSQRFGAGPGAVRDILRDALEGLTPDELHNAIEDGTLDEIVDFDAVLDEAERLIDEAVEEGRVTAEEGEAMLERLRDRIDALIEGELPDRFDRFREDFDLRELPGPGHWFFGGDAFGEAFGDAWGDIWDDVTPDDLRDAFEEGTLDELIDLESVLESAIEQIEQAVEDGTISEEQAEDLIDRLERRIDAIAEGEFGFGRGRGFGFFDPWSDEEASAGAGASA